ncbi:MAG: glycerol-3-phosphate dehydrogenase/oxidase [Bacteroidota bacterium]
MKRETAIAQIKEEHTWDIIVIGGGATGLGAAIDAATRGYKTLLLEQHDFTKGTSSRSTKLVHGGVRYLAQGNIALVLEALRERGLMHRNAPHLVSDLSFLIPSFSWWSIPFYTIGLTLYDFLAGRLGFGRSLPQSKNSTIEKIPTVEKRGLRGSVLYHDGQFDDARMGINMAQTVHEQGGVALNYFKVKALKKSSGTISGVIARDEESGIEYTIQTKSVINATGVFVNKILQKDNPRAKDIVKVSQGVHIVLDKDFLPSSYGMMIPKTKDGRVVFAVPWHDKVILGTTDIPKSKALAEPVATDEEVDFILETACRYLAKKPTRLDVKSVFAGLRPLAAANDESEKTSEISRGHKIYSSQSGLITIIGGKWTTYRQMGQEVVNRAAKVGQLPPVKSATKSLHIHGYQENTDINDPMYFYGSDRQKIVDLMKKEPGLKAWVSEDLKISAAQIVWACREEYARTVEDVLSRRTRALVLDAAESIRMAPAVASIMALELKCDKEWKKEQVDQFNQIAETYLIR